VTAFESLHWEFDEGEAENERKNRMKSQTKRKQWTIIRLILLWVLIFSSYPDAARADDDDDADRAAAVPGQVIVKLQPGVTIDSINQTYGTVTVTELAPGRGVYLLQTPEGSDVEVLLDRMEADERLVYAEPNLIAEAPESIRSKDWNWGGHDAEPYTDQYALPSINLAGAHSHSTGANTITAVIDTGVQLNHPVLVGRITTVQADFIDGDGIANDEGNGLDDDGDGEVDESTGHGTHVAGLSLLVAPDTRIMPVRALDSDGMGDAFSVAEAILFVVENGANVINLSLGTTGESDLLEEVTEQAAHSGVLVVAAAGNLGTSQEVYPAANECALAVTAVGPTDLRSSFASYGSWVDLAAPGESIYSSFPVDGYAWWSGTSMAAPFVSGQAALLLSYDPSLDILDVADLLGGTAQSLDSANGRQAGLLGAGKINVLASLVALAEGEIPNGPGLLAEDCGAVPPVGGDDVTGTCQSLLGAVTVRDLQVPQGANCTLNGTRVEGNIKVEKDASLTAQGVTFTGNIQGEGARLVEVLAGSTVWGSIQLKHGGPVRIENTSVNRDIQLESNKGVLNVLGNQFGGNIQVFQTVGDVTIANNTVNGNLQCKGNSPPPGGGNNTVRGNKEDQCAGL
jgi:subtilisin family serine protease